MNTPRVLIVILTYNGRDLTLACLRSLGDVAFPSFHVLLIDNASTDGTLDEVRLRFPGVEVLACEENLGYAKGNNLGLQYAYANGYDSVLLLNNDTEVDPHFLEPMVSALEDNHAHGAAGPLIYYYSRPTVIWSAGGNVSRSAGTTAMRGLDEIDTGQFGKSEPVDFVTGCALLVRVSILPETGVIDPRFGMYYEETEWCARIRDAGHGILYVPEAKVWHKISPERQALSRRVTYYMTRNRLLYMRLTGAPLVAWIHAALLQDWRTWLSWGVRPRWKDRREARKAIPAAWRDFILGRYGMVSFTE